MSGLEHLLENNKRWAARMTAQDPRFFADLADQQAPEYLWIGCSDSRVSANTIVDLQPGEVFVHRNVANLVNHTDMNCLSVMWFAVEVLKVKHIIVCGHYGCGGVKAAYDDTRLGLVDNWLRHIQDIMHKYEAVIERLPDHEARLDKLCELNVIEQVISVGETTIVQDAWDRGQEVAIHGWIYRIAEGIYRDMNITARSLAELDSLREKTYSNRGSIGTLHAN